MTTTSYAEYTSPPVSEPMDDKKTGNTVDNEIEMSPSMISKSPELDDWNTFKKQYIQKNQQFIDMIQSNINALNDRNSANINDNGNDSESSTKQMIENLENKLNEYQQFNAKSLKSATQTILDKLSKNDHDRTQIVNMDDVDDPSNKSIEDKLVEISDRQKKYQKELHSHVFRLTATIIVTFLAIIAYINPKRNRFPE